MNLEFYNSNFVYFPLPKQAAGTIYKKKINIGNITLLSSLQIPYGLYGRLALVAITNLACRNQDLLISAFTLYDLLRSLKKGHPTSTQLDKFLFQLQNWSSTLVSVDYKDTKKFVIKNLLMIEQAEFQLEKISTRKSYIKFTTDGKAFLEGAAFPIPSDAVRDIKTPLDFDILIWLISSMYCIRNTSDFSMISWNCLANQFCIQQNNLARFKYQFATSLMSIQQAYYPTAQLTISANGVFLKNSPLLTKEKNSYFLPNFV